MWGKRNSRATQPSLALASMLYAVLEALRGTLTYSGGPCIWSWCIALNKRGHSGNKSHSPVSERAVGLSGKV